MTRHNLGQEPGAFAGNEVVRTVLQSGGEQALPVILLDGRLRWTGTYPRRDELAAILAPADPAAVEDAACCDPGSQATTGAESGAVCCAPVPQTGTAVAPGGCC